MAERVMIRSRKEKMRMLELDHQTHPGDNLK
jgi:hypothetical protein